MGKNSKDEDLLLLEGCLRNDRVHQKALYRKYFKTMYQICIAYSGDREVAKDILQDAFVKVFTRLGSFDPKNSLEGWIRRIVTNSAIDHYRRKERLVFDQEIPDREQPEEDGPSLLEIPREVVFNGIRNLPDGARIVFNLFAIDGMAHKEIAEKLSISESTSKSQYQRARHLLKKWLTDFQHKQES